VFGLLPQGGDQNRAAGTVDAIIELRVRRTSKIECALDCGPKHSSNCSGNAGSPPPARSLLAMAGKLSAAEARRMVEEKRWALVRAHIACTDAIIKGRSASAARDYFDVYKRAAESNRKRLRHRGRRWHRLRF